MKSVLLGAIPAGLAWPLASRTTLVPMQAVNIPPYDNVDHRYRHTDGTADSSLQRVAELLGLSEPPAARDLYFDLSFFSGGIGVLDKLAISIPANAALWSTVCTFLRAKSPTQLTEDEIWAEDFVWLVAGDANFESIDNVSAAFINAERQPFQPDCDCKMKRFFQAESNVNDWTVVWGNDDRLNYLAYSQG